MCLFLDGLVLFLVGNRLCTPFSHITLPQKQSMQSHKASTTQKPSSLFQMNLKNFPKRLTKGSRTVTRLHGRGGFHPKEKDIVYVVIIRLEISKLKNIIYETDPNAFITIMDPQEARGGKFKTAIH